MESLATKWNERREGHQSTHMGQVRFISHVVHFVKYMRDVTAIPANAKDKPFKPLSKNVPLLGPVFNPLNPFLEADKRELSPDLKPDGLYYLQPVTVVHSFYFANLARCPDDLPAITRGEVTHQVKWDGWNTMGPREVYGSRRNEMAIGVQLRCLTCKARLRADTQDDRGDDQFCF